MTNNHVIRYPPHLFYKLLLPQGLQHSFLSQYNWELLQLELNMQFYFGQTLCVV